MFSLLNNLHFLTSFFLYSLLSDLSFHYFISSSSRGHKSPWCTSNLQSSVLIKMNLFQHLTQLTTPSSLEQIFFSITILYIFFHTFILCLFPSQSIILHLLLLNSLILECSRLGLWPFSRFIVYAKMRSPNSINLNAVSIMLSPQK